MCRNDDGMTAPHCSIVIVAHNQLQYTRLCIESIIKCTRYPHRLVLVDNGSTDGTEAYFRSIPKATVIRMEANAGFPRGANAGLRAADGKHVVLLNNDTIVTHGWLTRLVQAAEGDQNAGVIGPVTNHAKGAQLLERRDFRDAEELEQYAEMVADRNAGQRKVVDGLSGFCMLIKRELIDRVGYLDERFGIGNFEDDDYCMRARQAGFTLLIVMDCFIYHFGERTFLELGFTGERWKQLLGENEALFRAKWAAVAQETDARRAAASKLTEQGRALEERNDLVGALRKCVEALKEDPTNAIAHASVGSVLWKIGNKKKAYESFQRALSLNPNLEDARRWLTQVAAEIGAEKRAAAFLDRIRSTRTS